MSNDSKKSPRVRNHVVEDFKHYRDINRYRFGVDKC
jgi:hypothetical protein